MVIYYLTIEIPLLCLGIALWIYCCHFAKKHRETEDWPQRSSPSVFIIPMYEEEQEDEEEEEATDGYEAQFQPSCREPPEYCSRNISPPPPYMLEPPHYPDSPPSYTDPPAYSERP